MKKMLAFLLTLSLVLGTAGTASAAGTKVIVDGKTVNGECIIQNGRVLAPVRAVAEAMGATVQWDEASQKVTVTKLFYDNIGGVTNSQVRTAYMWIGKNVGNVNGDIQIDMDVPAQIINGNTMIPVEALGRMLSAEVRWDQLTQTVTMKSTLESTWGGAESSQAALDKVIEQYLNNVGKPDTKDPFYPYGYNCHYMENVSDSTIKMTFKNVTPFGLPSRECYIKVKERDTGKPLETVPFMVKELIADEEVTIIMANPTKKYNASAPEPIQYEIIEQLPGGGVFTKSQGSENLGDRYKAMFYAEFYLSPTK